jgi:hypothetical protein
MRLRKGEIEARQANAGLTEHGRKENHGREDQVPLVAEPFMREEELLHHLSYGQRMPYSGGLSHTYLSANEQF